MFGNNSNGMSAKFLNRMMKKVGGVVWDLSTGNLGLSDDNGIYTLTQDYVAGVAAVAASEGNPAVKAIEAYTEFGVSVNPFEAFGMSIPAFATAVPFDQVKPGDLLVGDRDVLGWVKEKTGSALKLLDKNGMSKNYTPPKVQIIGNGASSVMVIQSLVNLLGGQAGVGGLQNSLMPLLMMSGGDTSSLESMLPLMLFSQMQTTNSAVAVAGATAAGAGPAAANPMAAMMPMLMLQAMGKKNKSGGSAKMDPMLMMLMSGGMGGGAQSGGINPMMLMALQSMGGLGNDSDDGISPFASIDASNGTSAPALQKLGTPALRTLPRDARY